MSLPGAPARGWRATPATPLVGVLSVLALLALSLSGCASNGSSTGGASATHAPGATATPSSPCAQADPGAIAFNGLSAVPGLSFPAGAVISSGTTSGGSGDNYTVTAYTVCFQGAESAINGFGGVPGSSMSGLQSAGWLENNLFPDPTPSNRSYLDYCSAPQNCLNSSGNGNPFTFVSFSGYATPASGYTTFSLKVATIAAPICLNDPAYYSGTPTYTIYADGNNPNSSNPTYHFQMPPATRNSTFQGGGTAGSTYVYFCSAGTANDVINFLQQSMTNDGYTISNQTATGFTAKTGTGPVYQIDVSVPGPNNYSLREFIPQ